MKSEKRIIIIDGDKDGKNVFIKEAKEDNYWTWNINHRNNLGRAASLMGWRGERDTEYYDFVDKLEAMAEEHYGFKSLYTLEKIEAFIMSDKTDLLLIHRFDMVNNKVLHDVLKAKFNATTVKINNASDEEISENDGLYDAVMEFDIDNQEPFLYDVVIVLEGAGTYTNEKESLENGE